MQRQTPHTHLRHTSWDFLLLFLERLATGKIVIFVQFSLTTIIVVFIVVVE